MLSILIPIYNQNVSKLVTDLHGQCHKAKIPFEIILFDDKSKDKYREENRKLAGIFNVSYLELSENYGRARIRNLLGKNARYEKLLFLDCDSKLVAKKYIKNYISLLDVHDVIYGGRVYPKKKPKAKSKILHWSYGRKREALSANKRRKNPYLSFQSNNFIIDRSLFLEIKFESDLSKYGYEDLVFSSELKSKEIAIGHVENPIRHAGLEKTEVFLRKQMDAIDNLVTLRQQRKIMYTKLYRAYNKLEKTGMVKVFQKSYSKIEDSIKSSLHSDNPKMLYLDLWKLNHLSKLIKSKK